MSNDDLIIYDDEIIDGDGYELGEALDYVGYDEDDNDIIDELEGQIALLADQPGWNWKKAFRKVISNPLVNPAALIRNKTVQNVLDPASYLANKVTRKRSAPRRPVVVRRPTPQPLNVKGVSTQNNWLLGFNSNEEIGPQQIGEVTSKALKRFIPTKLIIPSQVAQYFVIREINVGLERITLSNDAIPASVFQEDSNAGLLPRIVVEASTEIRIEVKCIRPSKKDTAGVETLPGASFHAAFVGTCA